MLIRIKNTDKTIEDILVQPDQVDCWIDTERGSLYIEINGKKRLLKKSRKEKLLFEMMDRIYDAMRKNTFLDLTE